MSTHKGRRPPIPVIVLVVLVLVGVIGWFAWQATRPAQAGVALTGQVESTQSDVAPALAGRIVEVAVDEGDTVTKGQTLVRLDDVALRLQLRQAREGVKAAKAALDNEKDDGSKADVRAARARLAQARAAVSLAIVQLRYATVTAPRDGRVITVIANPGENAAPGKTLLTLADPADLFVRIFVPETQIGQVGIGRRARVSTDSTTAGYDATVSYVSDRAEFTPNNVETRDQRTKLVYEVRLAIEDASGTLKAGMPVDVVLS